MLANSVVLGALLALLLFFGLADRAGAQAYPARPVTIIVPAPAGGGIDITARLVAQALQTELNKTFVVENKGGASGNIGTTAAKLTAPDGHTLLMTISGFMVTNPALFASLQWDPVRDFTGVATILRSPQTVVANKNVPFNTLPELVAYAKANPGKLNFGSPGVGTQNQIAAENLAQMTGIQMTTIQYRAVAQAMQDLVAGTVDIFFNTTQSLVGPIQGKQVKPIAILGPNRLPVFPEVPTAREQGFPQLEIDTWYALYAPAGTPKPVLDLLGETLKKVTEREDFKAKVRDTGAEMFFKGPEETTQYTKEQVAFWSGIIKRLGIKVQQ